MVINIQGNFLLDQVILKSDLCLFCMLYKLVDGLVNPGFLEAFLAAWRENHLSLKFSDVGLHVWEKKVGPCNCCPNKNLLLRPMV